VNRPGKIIKASKVKDIMKPPSDYMKNKTWDNTLQYANIMRDLITSQVTQYKLEKNRSKKRKISTNIAYLTQTLFSMKELRHS